MLIDTHAHFYSEQFDEDLAFAIERAKDHGVSKVIMPNIDIPSIDIMHQLEDNHPDFFVSMMGIHPCYVKADYQEDLDVAKLWFTKRRYCAVGEIGIDLYWDKTLLEQQKEAFQQQLQWAKELNLPVAIHARDSFQEIFEVIEKENSEHLKGVFHCFTGGDSEYEKIKSFGGFKIGIGGVLTFKKSGLDEVLKNISLDEMVLETDAPYLAPTPFRGKRNEPSYLLKIAEKLADVKGVSLETVAQVTTNNAIELFKL